MTKKTRKLLHKEIYQKWKDSQPKSEFKLEYNLFKVTLDDYMRSKTHPRAAEFYSLAPDMCDEVRDKIRERYPDLKMSEEEYKKTIENVLYSENPFLKLIKKTEDFSGKYIPVPIYYK